MSQRPRKHQPPLSIKTHNQSLDELTLNKYNKPRQTTSTSSTVARASAQKLKTHTQQSQPSFESFPNAGKQPTNKQTTQPHQTLSNPHSTTIKRASTNKKKKQKPSDSHYSKMGFLGDKYREYKDAKDGRSSKFSDDDIEKYTGKSRAELDKWAVSTEGVGRWQHASSLLAGGTVGMGMNEMPTHVDRGKLKYGPEWEARTKAWEDQQGKDQMEKAQRVDEVKK